MIKKFWTKKDNKEIRDSAFSEEAGRNRTESDELFSNQMRSEEENENKTRKHWGTGSRAACPVKLRKALLMAGAVGLLAGGVGLIVFAMPREEKIEEIISSYTIKADSTYRVHMRPNDLLPGEWQEEGKFYSNKLTDFIEIQLKSEAILTNQETISGNYEVTAVLEGYLMDEEQKKTVYEQRYPIKKGVVQHEMNNHSVIEESIRIRPSEHLQNAERADVILGGSTARSLYILFEGRFVVNEQEKEFSYKLPIPAGKEAFYSIAKPEPIEEKGDITETDMIKKLPQLRNYLHFLLLLMIGLLLAGYILFFTRKPTQEEQWEYDLREIMRKYGSRMICVEELPKEGTTTILRLSDMGSMVALAEELREPVLYCVDSSGLPVEGQFCILGEEYMYVLRVDKPSTTLVEEKTHFESEENTVKEK